MSVAASVAIAVAERVERTGGLRAGLVVWKKLAVSSLDAEVRGKALLAALRCALALRDHATIDELVLQWRGIEHGVWGAAIASHCKALARAGLLPRAILLAQAEAERDPTARSLYCHARCLDVARDTRATDVFRDAIRRAEKEGAREIELASRVRLAAILARSWFTMNDAFEEARRVDLSQVPAASRIVVGRVLLQSPSRFSRAAALGTLHDVIVGDDRALAMRALVVVARWVDDAGDALTPLEEDRLLALFGRDAVVELAPRARDVVRVLAHFAKSRDPTILAAAMDEGARVAPELAPLHSRARDILSGRFEVMRDVVEAPPEIAALRRAFRYGEMLDVVVALRDRAPARATSALRLLADADQAGERLPALVFGVAQAALSYGDDELRAVAERIIGARLRSATGGVPPHGFTSLADTLARLGMSEHALAARRAAVVAKEPGAAASLGSSLARQGWDLAKTGNRERAIRTLREAKSLLERKT